MPQGLRTKIGQRTCVLQEHLDGDEIDVRVHNRQSRLGVVAQVLQYPSLRVERAIIEREIATLDQPQNSEARDRLRNARQAERGVRCEMEMPSVHTLPARLKINWGVHTHCFARLEVISHPWHPRGYVSTHLELDR
eukprot:2675281-Rhodomonas_salina.4